MSEVREDAVEKAKRLGLLLVKPTDTQVFVDIDSPEALLIFHQRLVVFQRIYRESYVEKVSPSQTIGHYHAIVEIPEMKCIGQHERIALQAILGSDPLRDTLAIYHGRAGYEHTSVFFEKP